MRPITVGMGELGVSADPSSVLVTYALGSCIAVLVHDPVRRVGGMIHYMLPSSATASHRGEGRPAMFADTGLPLLFQRMRGWGCQQSDLIIRVVGGANMREEHGHFAIGKRNYAMACKLFAEAGLDIHACDVGGRVSRTVRLFVGDGRARLRASDRDYEIDL